MLYTKQENRLCPEEINLKSLTVQTLKMWLGAYWCWLQFVEEKCQISCGENGLAILKLMIW